MSPAVVDAWVEAPLKRFVDDARVGLAVLLNVSGQVLGQHGFTRSVDVMTACVLAAAATATSAELGRQVDGRPFSGLHYAGTVRQIFLGPVPTPRAPMILLAVFDEESSLGLVQLFFAEFCTAAAVAAAAAGPEPAARAEATALRDDFELDLNRNLAVLFGRA